VGEAVLAAPGLGDDPGRQQQVQRVHGQVRVQARRLDHQVEFEGPAGGGRRAQQPAGYGVEPGELGRRVLVDGRGQLLGRAGAVLLTRPQQHLQQQVRVAGGVGHQPLRGRDLLDELRRHDLVDEVRHLRLGQAGQGEAVQPAVLVDLLDGGHQPPRTLRRQPSGAHDQDRRLVPAPEQLPEQGEGARAREIQVVEEQQHRPVAGDPRQQVGDRGCVPSGGGFLGHGGHELTRLCRDAVVQAGGEQRADGFHERLTRHGRVAVAAAVRHQAAGQADATSGLGGEAGLADARLAGDQHHVAGAAFGAEPGTGQGRQLSPAADERCGRARAGGVVRTVRVLPVTEQLHIGRLALGRRVDAQFVGQGAAQVVVGTHGLGPVPGGHVRGHPGAVGALAQGCAADRLVGEPQRRRAVTTGSCRVARRLQAGDQQLGQPVPHVDHPVAVVVGQQRTSQAGDGRLGQPLRPLELPRRVRADGLGHLTLGHLEIDHRAGRQREQVPPAPSHHIGVPPDAICHERANAAHHAP
jgi:hypothetical protein